ncbi:C40 family peptidase [Thermobifida cellulosilytica]|uniref:Glycoside hydrolase n=1 Tax=Thermobifida cellulosilytica TB100 TaxID=665004 RepID=A0A147KD04_THECS|nr:NlpC/P60 family protein [Thermobifida cellulosilytica]KUP95181.1 glycoside hydrolase [Thermobifida cellulosilytica TB100]
MADKGGRRAARRIATGLGFVAAGSLVLPQGIAHAEPTQEEVEAKLQDLHEEASALVDEYNAIQEEYEAAKQKVEEIEKQLGDEEERYEELREKVAGFASAAYMSPDLEAVSTILSVDDPSEILEQSADLSYLSESQRAELEEFSNSSERLIQLKEENEALLEEAEDKKKEVEDKQKEVEDKIAEQEDLLAQFPGADPLTQGSSSAGGSYSGPASGNARTALDYAYAQLGKPYIWGGTGPDGFDCSGLTMRAWGAAGVSLPRTTYAQATVGSRVSYDSMQPGDLIFFYPELGHVGMYVGGGQMIHAPSSGRTIEVVSLSGYWSQHFQFAVRP